MPDSIKNKKKYKKLLSNFLLLLSIANLITVVGYNLVSLASSYSICKETEEVTLKQQCQNFTNQLDTALEYKENILSNFANNKAIIDFLSQAASVTSSKEIKSLTAFNSVSNNLATLKNLDNSFGMSWISLNEDNFIITDNGEISNTSNHILSEHNIYSDLVFNTSENKPWISYKTQSNINHQEMITIIAPINDSQDKILGYVGVDIFMDKFAELVEDIDIPQSCSAYITDINGNVLYDQPSNKFNSQDTAFASLKHNFFSYEPNTITPLKTQHNSTIYAINSIAKNSQFHVLIFNQDNSFYQSFIKVSLKNIITLLLLSGIVIILPLGIYLKRSLKDTPKICTAVNEIDNGNYNYKINSTLTTEIGQISDTIDHLTDIFQNKIGTLEKIACYDRLTGLPNQYQLDNIINHYLDKCKKNNTKFAVVYCDIDNFKWLNDSFGKEFCDNLLIVFTEKLKNTFGKIGEITRPRSDSFILLMDFSEIAEIDNAIQKIRAALLHRISYNDNNTYLKFSVGISTYPECGDTAEILIRNSNIATDYVKKHGKNNTCYYTCDMYNAIHRQILIEKYLNKAIADNEFYLHYQPVFDCKTKEIVAIEAFIRWYNNELGSILPQEFLPIAERNGTVSIIMDWVFQTACEFHKKVSEACCRQDIIISINIASVQPKQASFVDNMKEKIEKSGINPRCLQLEVSESIMRDLINHKCFSTNELFAMGVNMAFDQYGIGCSSPSYMNYFRMTCLKIDRSMVHKLPHSPHDAEIVGSVIRLCNKFGNKVVATGIETQEQLNIMNALNVNYAQGNLLCKPLSETEAMEFCTKYQEERDKENGFY